MGSLGIAATRCSTGSELATNAWSITRMVAGRRTTSASAPGRNEGQGLKG